MCGQHRKLGSEVQQLKESTQSQWNEQDARVNALSSRVEELEKRATITVQEKDQRIMFLETQMREQTQSMQKLVQDVQGFRAHHPTVRERWVAALKNKIAKLESHTLVALHEKEEQVAALQFDHKDANKNVDELIQRMMENEGEIAELKKSTTVAAFSLSEGSAQNGKKRKLADGVYSASKGAGTRYATPDSVPTVGIHMLTTTLESSKPDKYV